MESRFGLVDAIPLNKEHLVGGTSGKTTHFVRFGVVNPCVENGAISTVNRWIFEG